ncbi:unnamed protein product, partial [Closterium sp. NIES-54]
MAVVSLDFITGLPSTSRGHDAILVVVDKFSKMGHFIPTNATARAEATARLFFDRIITIHVIPATLISDRDPKFTTRFPALHACVLPCPAPRRTALPCTPARCPALLASALPCPARLPAALPSALLRCPAPLASVLPCPACLRTALPRAPPRCPAPSAFRGTRIGGVEVPGGVEAASLGAFDSASAGAEPEEALHTLTLDSSVSHCFFRDNTTSTPLTAPIPVTLATPPEWVTVTQPGGELLTICTNSRTDEHLATFTRRPGSPLNTLTTESALVAESGQVAASVEVAASCLCRLLTHQILLWHHRLGHPSLPRLHGMHSRLLRAAPHSSFPPPNAPLQTLQMDVWGPARVTGQGGERYFLLVVDDYTRYTTVFPLQSKADVHGVLIRWIRAIRLQLRARFRQDLPVLRLHSERGGIAECRIGLVME